MASMSSRSRFLPRVNLLPFSTENQRITATDNIAGGYGLDGDVLAVCSSYLTALQMVLWTSHRFLSDAPRATAGEQPEQFGTIQACTGLILCVVVAGIELDMAADRIKLSLTNQV